MRHDRAGWAVLAAGAAVGPLGEIMTTSPGTQVKPLAETAGHKGRLLPPARYRHPGDVIRLITAGLVLAGALAVTVTTHATYAGASAAGRLEDGGIRAAPDRRRA